jgi:hypothetical protein
MFSKMFHSLLFVQMFIHSILENISVYAFQKCAAENTRDWACRLVKFWNDHLANMKKLAMCMMSVNPLLNALIYAGFLRRYRARMRGLVLPLLMTVQFVRLRCMKNKEATVTVTMTAASAGK